MGEMVPPVGAPDEAPRGSSDDQGGGDVDPNLHDGEVETVVEEDEEDPVGGGAITGGNGLLVDDAMMVALSPVPLACKCGALLTEDGWCSAGCAVKPTERQALLYGKRRLDRLKSGEISNPYRVHF